MLSHRRLATASCLLLFGVAGLTGCGAGAQGPAVDDLVFVVSGASGTSAPDPSTIDGLLSVIDAEGDHVVVIRADGTPDAVLDVTLPALPGNGSDRETWLRSLRDDIVAAVLDVRAVDPEIDVTEAIALGAEAFRDGAAHTLVVETSGLQTTGALSMLDGRLYAEPADLVSHAEQVGGIPDLAGARVRMSLGVVVDPQPALTDGARAALAGIWQEYFARAGATDVDLAAAALTPRPYADELLPDVSPVPIERPGPGPVADCRQELGTASIGFEAGSSALADPEGVRALLAGSAAALASCPGEFLVEASASSEGEEDANEALSLERAQAVARELAQTVGIPVAQIRIIGWGEAWPCRVADLDADGRLVLEAATANRVVVVGKGDPGC